MLIQSADGWELARPVTNRQGYTLLGFIPPERVDAHLHTPVTAALVAYKVGRRYLVGFNRSRNRWELPAGRIEWGETAIEAAHRELKEEAGQTAETLISRGLAHAKRSTGYKKFTAVFSCTTERLEPFRANDEWSRIDLRDLSDAPLLDPLDRALLTYLELEQASPR